MLKKLAIIAVAFSLAASWGMPLRARAQVLIPRSALLVQPKPAKLQLATVTPSRAVVVAPDQPGKWEPIINRFDAYIDWDSVHASGFSGTGVGEHFRFQTDFNIPHFTNVFEYERTNAAQSVLFGTLVIDENDDEDDWTSSSGLKANRGLARAHQPGVAIISMHRTLACPPTFSCDRSARARR